MKIIVDRNSEYSCFAADVENYKVTIDCNSMEDLDKFLFDFLPHKESVKPNVWSIMLLRKGRELEYACFVDGSMLRWIDHFDKVIKLEENDLIDCEFHDTSFHAIGEPENIYDQDLLTRVRSYMTQRAQWGMLPS